MSAIPVPDPVVEDSRERILLTGDLPSPANPPSGCRFHTRCPWRQEPLCDTERPQLRIVDIDGAGSGHKVACHWAEDIAAGRVRPHEVIPEADETGAELAARQEAERLAEELPFA